MLSKKYYQVFANIIERQVESLPEFSKTNEYQKGRYWACNQIANKLADYFMEDNDLFDRCRFLNACGFKKKEE